MRSLLFITIIILFQLPSFSQQYLKVLDLNPDISVTQKASGDIYIKADTIDRKKSNGDFFFIHFQNISVSVLVIPTQGFCYNDAFSISRWSRKYQHIPPGKKGKIKISWYLGKNKRHIRKTAYIDIMTSKPSSRIKRIQVDLRVFVTDK